MTRYLLPCPLTGHWMALLRSRRDDLEAPLRVEVLAAGRAIEVTRADGSELSETEDRHVRGVLAAMRTR